MSRTGLSTMRSWLSSIRFMARMLEYSLTGFTWMSGSEKENQRKPIHFCSARTRFLVSFFLAIRSPASPHFEPLASLSPSLQEVVQFVLSLGGESGLIMKVCCYLVHFHRVWYLSCPYQS